MFHQERTKVDRNAFHGKNPKILKLRTLILDEFMALLKQTELF
jgi:hypothetical protein